MRVRTSHVTSDTVHIHVSNANDDSTCHVHTFMVLRRPPFMIVMIMNVVIISSSSSSSMLLLLSLLRAAPGKATIKFKKENEASIDFSPKGGRYVHIISLLLSLLLIHVLSLFCLLLLLLLS